ncbi:hypothetical protein B0H10DRAFT_2214410 [Mycena sp. CBHHK59/15]|nr:hypothetical protein B0H10DRAFT_2214410 [Mycena sp. CBHHK59/15]
MKLTLALLISFIAAVVANPAIPREPALEACVSISPLSLTTMLCGGVRLFRRHRRGEPLLGIRIHLRDRERLWGPELRDGLYLHRCAALRS